MCVCGSIQRNNVSNLYTFYIYSQYTHTHTELIVYVHNSFLFEIEALNIKVYVWLVPSIGWGGEGLICIEDIIESKMSIILPDYLKKKESFISVSNLQ